MDSKALLYPKKPPKHLALTGLLSRLSAVEVAQGNQPFGEEDTELFKSLNFLSSSLYNQESKMDEATREAYAKYEAHSEAVRGF